MGKEAVTVLPIGQLTVHSLPATVSHPSLTSLKTDTNNNVIPFIHPHYDNPEEINYHPSAQILWAYNNSHKYQTANNADSDYQYTAIETLPSNVGTALLGLGSPNHGGGVHEPNVMFHEIFGHGLGLPHTDIKGENDQLIYPYDPHSHGKTQLITNLGNIISLITISIVT